MSKKCLILFLTNPTVHAGTPSCGPFSSQRPTSARWTSLSIDGRPRPGLLFRPAGPSALYRLIQSHSVCLSTFARRAISPRPPAPSITRAIASRRRASARLLHFRANALISSAVWSVFVISMPAGMASSCECLHDNHKIQEAGTGRTPHDVLVLFMSH